MARTALGAVNCSSPASAPLGVRYPELWPFPLLSVSAAWGGQEGLGTRVQCKKGKAGKRKQKPRRDNDRGGKRTKETAQCRRSTWRTLCHPSSQPALRAVPCSAPITCLCLPDCRGGEHRREGTGSRVLLGMAFGDIVF